MWQAAGLKDALKWWCPTVAAAWRSNPIDDFLQWGPTYDSSICTNRPRSMSFLMDFVEDMMTFFRYKAHPSGCTCTASSQPHGHPQPSHRTTKSTVPAESSRSTASRLPWTKLSRCLRCAWQGEHPDRLPLYIYWVYKSAYNWITKIIHYIDT